jgi:hypothetical protein
VRILYSLADPSILILFQVLFTFWVLLLVGLLPPGDLVGYVFFFCVLAATAQWRTEKVKKPWISTREWLFFSYVFFWMLLIANAFLLHERGFLLLSSHLASARLHFYQGWGIFKRLNELGIGVVGIAGFGLWNRRKKKTAILFLLLTAYLILSLGSREGLLSYLFLYGAYARFAPKQASGRALLLIAAALGLSSLAIFYLMFGNSFLVQFAVRLLAYCDGPVYFFASHLSGKIYYGPGYMFDTFAYAARLRTKPEYESLGQVLNWYFLYYDNPLTGPNPQFPVESHVLLGWAYLGWYGLAAWMFVAARKFAATAYSFFINCMIVGSLLIDSQLAGSELFNALLLAILIGTVLSLRRLTLLAIKSFHSEVALARQ